MIAFEGGFGHLKFVNKDYPFPRPSWRGFGYFAVVRAASQASISESTQRVHWADNFLGLGKFVVVLTQRQIVAL